jgi:hypothetical protein
MAGTACCLGKQVYLEDPAGEVTSGQPCFYLYSNMQAAVVDAVHKRGCNAQLVQCWN